MFKKLIAGIILFLGIASVALGVPQYMNYQGVLRDNAGNLVTGTKAMTFKIFNAATSGTELWTMTSSEVKVNSGLYNVQLGPLGGVDMTSGRRWIEAAVGTDTLSPRLEILAVAYALLAASAESASKVSGYSVASSGSGDFIPLATSGKLNASVIPASGVSVASAEYATQAGNASTSTYAGTAGTAETVDGFHASSTPTGGYLLALDSNKQLKTSISAEAQSNPFALFVNGKFGATTSVVSIEVMPAGQNYIDVNNSAITNSSAIFVTAGPKDFDLGGVYISSRAANTFRIKSTNNAPALGMPIWYMIIN